MKPSAGTIIGLVLLSHYAYYIAPADDQAQWFYVLRGVSGAVLFGILARQLGANGGLALVGAMWGAFEEIQTAACGIGAYDLPVKPISGLCVARFGYWPYLIAAYASVCYLSRHRLRLGIMTTCVLIVSAWRRLRSRGNGRP